MRCHLRSSSPEGAVARIALLLLLAASLCCVVAAADGVEAAQPVGSSGAHIFHSGVDALSWDSDALSHVRNLHGVDFTDEQAFIEAGDIATHLGLEPITGVHMPVPLRIIFVGFAKDGNMQVDIPQEDLQLWFGHLDHVLPHTRIELADLTCSEDGHCAGLVQGKYRPQPMHSFVHLNFSCQVVVVRKGSVVKAFERAIHTFSRPVDPAQETGTHQVDASKMEGFIASFLSYHVPDNTYSMVVINPSWSAQDPQYGYRLGFSAAEVELLQQRSDEFVKLLHTGSSDKQEPQPPMFDGGPSTWFDTQKSAPKFEVVNLDVQSDGWVTAIGPYLRDEEALLHSLLELAGKEPGATALVQATRAMYFRARSTATTILEEELHEVFKPNTLTERNVHSRYVTMHPAEDCLVSTWVGPERWLLVDLSAAGRDWGPAQGGEGTVTRHTLPDVHELFKSLKETKHEIRDALISINDTEVQMEQSLVKDKQRRKQTMQTHFARWQSAEATKIDGTKTLDEVEALLSRRYREFSAKIELPMYETFFRRFCRNQQPLPMVCAKMKEEYDVLRSQAARMASSTGADFHLHNNHDTNFFADDPEWEKQFEEIEEEASRSRALFMAELSSVLSRGLRHVIAPPSATWRRSALQAHDVSTHYTRVVRFHLYVLGDSSQAKWSEPHTANSAFNLVAYQAEVRRLKLEAQEFYFLIEYVSLLDDPELAVGFAASLKTAAHGVPSLEETMDEVEQTYVDSREMAPYLRKRFPEHGQRNADTRAARQRESHEISVFVFQIERSTAVLIDEHYSARAMGDMVLVIHNSARHDEHPSGMMCDGQLVARPLSPMRAALGATLLALGGVLPPHLGYSPMHASVTHDWLWSVGDNPLAFTSAGTKFSQLQIDALARSHALDALDTTVDLINRGIKTLRAVATAPPKPHSFASSAIGGLLQASREGRGSGGGAGRGEEGEDEESAGKTKGWLRMKRRKPPVIPAAKLKEIMELYSNIILTWRIIMGWAYDLDWSSATTNAVFLEEDAAQFLALTREVAGLLPDGSSAPRTVQASQCRSRHADAVLDPRQRLLDRVMVASVAAAGLALLYALWPLIRAVPKLRKRRE